MANLSQSPISPNSFRPEPVESGMSLRRQGKAWHRTAVMMAAWLGKIVGASFLFALNALYQFLFGATPEGIGVLFVRFARVALNGLGIACLPSNLTIMRQATVRGLLIFNLGTTIFFAWVALATTFHGVVLWPVVILYAVIPIALLLSLRHGVYFGICPGLPQCMCRIPRN
jgi:hypothetical protein